LSPASRSSSFSPSWTGATVISLSPRSAISSSFSSRKCAHRRPGHRSSHEYVSPRCTRLAIVPHHRSKQAGNQYLTTLTIYFIGYVLFEVPANIVLKLTTPRFWLPTLTLAWGIVSTLMGVTQNFSGFLAVRFFLGVAESGFFPGVVFYMSMWYKRNEQHYRIALFFSAATLAGAFGGIFASPRFPLCLPYHNSTRCRPLVSLK